MRCPECKHEHPVACPSCRAEIQDEEIATIPDAPADEPPGDDVPPGETITPDERPAPIEETPAETPRAKKTLFEHLFGE